MMQMFSLGGVIFECTIVNEDKKVIILELLFNLVHRINLDLLFLMKKMIDYLPKRAQMIHLTSSDGTIT